MQSCKSCVMIESIGIWISGWTWSHGLVTLNVLTFLFQLVSDKRSYLCFFRFFSSSKTWFRQILWAVLENNGKYKIHDFHFQVSYLVEQLFFLFPIHVNCDPVCFLFLVYSFKHGFK
jgi:hypothetical protein